MLFVTVGCSRFETIEECRRIANLVNPTLSEVSELGKQSPPTPVTYRTIETRYAALSRLLRTKPIANPALAPLVQEFGELYDGASKSARGYAEALERKDQNRVSASKATASQQSKRERSLTRRFRMACHHD